MGIRPEHIRASYDTYIKHGNSSSATIVSVVDRLRQKEMDELAPGGKVKDFVVGCAFGPGIAIEMCMLKRNLNHVRRTLVTSISEDAALHERKTNGSRSENERDTELEVDIRRLRERGKGLGQSLEVLEQTKSLGEALDSVDLD